MKNEKSKLNLGKKQGTMGHNNSLWIKKFENGVKIRKRGEAEITLSMYEVYEMVMDLRKFCAKVGGYTFFASFDLIPVWQKYPETEEFITRLINGKVGDKEIEHISKMYELKNEIIDKLGGKK